MEIRLKKTFWDRNRKQTVSITIITTAENQIAFNFDNYFFALYMYVRVLCTCVCTGIFIYYKTLVDIQVQPKRPARF